MKKLVELVKLRTKTVVDSTSAYSLIDLFTFSIFNFNNNYFIKH